ncbi:MAG: hypothetical protein ACE5H8_04005 [Alphaproteobacteria bacterium]
MTTTLRRNPRKVKSKAVSRRQRRDLPLVDFASLRPAQLEVMAEAGCEVLECQRVLAKGGSNVVAEVLPREGTFYEFDHCPAGDVYDQENHAQYYYHAHREGEHGHFHTFLREAGMPPGVQPVEQTETDAMKQRDDNLSHLVAISMDGRGFPIGLFTTNRWVTAENWYAATDVAAMLDCFVIDHARPSWPTNRWVTAMLRLFRPQIVALLHQRDTVVAEWRKRHPQEDAFEDRRLGLPSRIEISVDQQIRAIRAALDGRR